MHRVIKIDVNVDLDCVERNAQRTWRASSAKLELEAFGQTPDEAASNFKRDMLAGSIKRKEEYKTPEPKKEEEVLPQEEESASVASAPQSFESLGKKELQEIAEARGIETKGLLKKDLIDALAGGSEDEIDIKPTEEDVESAD